MGERARIAASLVASSPLVCLPWRSKEAVYRVVGVGRHPDDHAFDIETVRESALPGACTRARSIELRDTTFCRADEPVNYVARVDVLSGYRHGRIYAVRKCALAGASPCTRNAKRGVVSFPAAQKSMSDAVGIDVVR